MFNLKYFNILGIIKINDHMSLSKYTMKYLELVFVLTNFHITKLSTLPNFYRFFCSIKLYCPFSVFSNFTIITLYTSFCEYFFS